MKFSMEYFTYFTADLRHCKINVYQYKSYRTIAKVPTDRKHPLQSDDLPVTPGPDNLGRH